jgi:hypothetical protein
VRLRLEVELELRSNEYMGTPSDGVDGDEDDVDKSPSRLQHDTHQHYSIHLSPHPHPFLRPFLAMHLLYNNTMPLFPVPALQLNTSPACGALVVEEEEHVG